MAWIDTNKAALATWLNLKALDQIPMSKSFSSTKDVKMNKLLFYPAAASAEMLGIRSNSLATQIHNLNRSYWGSKMEDGATTKKSIQAMKEILIDKTKTCADLAVAMDARYRFVNE